jgi:LysR family transcriptional activator of nhaA
MTWFNYNHLFYFWTVANEGSIARATEKLHVTQSTVSEQLKTLEQTLGETLFERQRRRLVLTELGKVVYRYADDIFALGRELVDAIGDRPTGRPLRFSVGISDVVPKAIAHRFLAPVLTMSPEVHLICTEDQPARLLADLAIHELDLVISDAPSTGSTIRLFNHLLAESHVTLYAPAALARSLRRRFPRSLHGKPFLLPQRGTELRRKLEQWFEAQQIRPRVVAEFQDTALLKVFARFGAGAFASTALIEEELRQAYHVIPAGDIGEIRESFYAISRERKIKHPAIAAVLSAAAT